jgi:hypothetical protein
VSFVQDNILKKAKAASNAGTTKALHLQQLGIPCDSQVWIFLGAESGQFQVMCEFAIQPAYKDKQMSITHQFLATLKSCSFWVLLCLPALNMTTFGFSCCHVKDLRNSNTSFFQVASKTVLGQTMRAFRMVPADMRPNTEMIAWRVFPVSCAGDGKNGLFEQINCNGGRLAYPCPSR